MQSQIDTIRNTLFEFAKEFICSPYLCYTEHGLHALYYSRLSTALQTEEQSLIWENLKVCVIQKEYPTNGKLGKSKRQHWDIVVLKNPPECVNSKRMHSYDYLRITAAIEFGLNEKESHLQDDIERLCHNDANVDHRFVVNLYRISKPGALISGRDQSSNSKEIVSKEKIVELTLGKDIEIIQGICDTTGKHETELFHYKNGNFLSLL